MSEPFSVTLPDMTYVTLPAAGSSLAADDALPWLIDLDVFEQAVSHTNWDTIIVAGTDLLNAYKISSGAQNDEINWDVVLAAGTWTVEVLGRMGPNEGIMSVQLDGVEKGTIDLYNATVIIVNQLNWVAGIAVATTAKYRLKLKMATKQAASGNYYGTISHVQMRRTA